MSTEEPSAQAFRALRGSVEALDDEGLKAMRSQLSSWPDESRSLLLSDDEEALSTRWASLATSFEIAECDALAAVRKLGKQAASQVRALSFFTCEGTADAVQRLDSFPHLHTLDLSGEVLEDDPAVFEALSTLSLPALRTLRLMAGHPPVTLTETDFWPALESLTLTLAEGDALGIAALFRDGRCPALKTLSLDMGARVDLAHALRESPVVSSLRSLGEVPFTAALSTLLTRAPQLEELSTIVTDALPAELPRSSVSSLSMRGSAGDAGMARLVKAFPRLHALSAHQTGIGPEGAASIGTLRTLSRLELSMNVLGDAAGHLVPALEGVIDLSLHHTGLGVQGLRALAPRFSTLRHLHLRGNPGIGPEGAARIAETPMPELRTLWLGGCQIGVEGARALAASTNLAHLRFFDLDLARADRELIPHGAHALATAPHASDTILAQFAAWKDAPPSPPKSLWKRLFGG